MKSRKPSSSARDFGLCLLCIALSGCVAVQEQTGTEKADGGEIPITTTSEEARELFLQGRDLADKIRFTDAREYFQKAVEQDENFALAHLSLANTATTAQEFFDSMRLAMAAIQAEGSTISEGERLMILGQDAAVRGDAASQKEFYGKLVEAHPNDARAHFLTAAFYGGRQEYDQAIEHLERATEINPEFSSAYNSLGYNYRSLEDYDAAG